MPANRAAQILDEAKAIWAATLAQASRLVSYGGAYRRLRDLDRAADDAQAALGQRLAELGQGDRGLLAQIAEADRRADDERQAGQMRRLTQAECRGARLRLAAPFIQAKPPPGAEEAQQAARAARAAWGRQKDQLGQAGTGLFPPQRRERLRVAVGVGLVAVLLCAAVWAVGPKATPHSATARDSEERYDDAVGGGLAPADMGTPGPASAGGGFSSPRPCHRCGGAGRTMCFACNGSGRERCLGCGGSGSVMSPSGRARCFLCNGGLKACTTCDFSSGYKRCFACNGTGKLN